MNWHQWRSAHRRHKDKDGVLTNNNTLCVSFFFARSHGKDSISSCHIMSYPRVVPHISLVIVCVFRRKTFLCLLPFFSNVRRCLSLHRPPYLYPYVYLYLYLYLFYQHVRAPDFREYMRGRVMR